MKAATTTPEQLAAREACQARRVSLMGDCRRWLRANEATIAVSGADAAVEYLANFIERDMHAWVREHDEASAKLGAANDAAWGTRTSNPRPAVAKDGK